MIKQETYIDGNGTKHKDLVRTFSDCNKVIKQVETGAEYDEAIDTKPLKYTYVETEKEIVKAEEEIIEDNEQEEVQDYE